MDQELLALFRVELLEGLVHQFVDRRVGIVHQIEAAAGLEHRGLIARDIPGESEHDHLEVIGLGDGGHENLVEVDRVGRGVNADRLPGLLEVSGELIVGAARAVGDFEGELGSALVEDAVAVAVGPTGGGQQAFRLGDIETVVGRDRGRVVGDRKRRLSAVGDACVAEINVLDDRRSVNRVEERLAGLDILEQRRVLRIELIAVEAEGVRVVEGNRGVGGLLERGDVGGIDRLIHVDRAGLQRGEERGAVRPGLENHLVDDRNAVVVVRILDERRGAVRRARGLEHEGSGADDAGRIRAGVARVAEPLVVADALPDVLRHDCGEGETEEDDGRDDVGRDDLNGVIIGLRIGANHGVERRRVGAAGGRVLGRVKAEDHVVRGERLAVMPLRVLVEVERVSLAVGGDLVVVRQVSDVGAVDRAAADQKLLNALDEGEGRVAVDGEEVKAGEVVRAEVAVDIGSALLLRRLVILPPGRQGRVVLVARDRLIRGEGRLRGRAADGRGAWAGHGARHRRGVLCERGNCVREGREARRRHANAAGGLDQRAPIDPPFNKIAIQIVELKSQVSSHAGLPFSESLRRAEIAPPAPKVSTDRHPRRTPKRRMNQSNSNIGQASIRQFRRLVAGNMHRLLGSDHVDPPITGIHVNTQAPSDVNATAEKLDSLRALVRSMESVLVSFSGGVDSALLLKVAHDELGDFAVAATGLSGSYAPEEMDDAAEVARAIGARHVMVSTMELTDPRYADNTHQRCFFCKTELYGKLRETADELGLREVVDGSNADDVGDFRPGMRAARDLRVRSPLLDVGLTKREIRDLSREFGLKTWDKPAAACLSSRFAYGDPITVEKLKQVAAAETFIRSLGYRGFRVRHHADVARLEFPVDQIPEILERREEIVRGVKAAGYQYVTIDLDGYRLGSMNEVLNARLQQGGLRRSSAV